MGSAEASGTFGRSAVFSTWKGRSYAKAHAIPENPKSNLQISVREMLGFLASQFKAFTAGQKATWEELATQRLLSPYNAYLSYNLDRWKRFHAPTKAYPITETGTQPEFDCMDTTGGVAHVDILTNWYSLDNAWAMLLFHSHTLPLTPSRANLLHVIPLVELSGNYWAYHTTVLGWHYFNLRTFTTTGKLSGNLGQYQTQVG